MTDSTNVNFPDTLVDYVLRVDSGYHPPKGQDTSEFLASMGARDFPDTLYIDPKDWKDKARENDELKTWAEDFRNRFSNQTPTHECTTHALMQCGETTWNAQAGTRDFAVFFSQMGIYGEANKSQWGGAGCQQVLGIAMRRGFIPERGVNNQDKIFKHTLWGTAGKGNDKNSRGPWTNINGFARVMGEDWKMTARHFRPTEVINPRSFEQIVCLLLHGRAIGVGRAGHSIPYTKVVWRGGKLHAYYPDSYDVVRYDSESMIRRAIGGSYCIWSMTTPDDYKLPAGDDTKREET